MRAFVFPSRALCLLVGASLLALTGGCASDIAATNGVGGTTSKVVTTTEGGVSTTTVDATDAAAWVYIDLDTGAEVTPAAPEDSDAWDIAFQRFTIKSNGGDSGTGGVEIAGVEGVTFDSVTAAPASGWFSDAPDSDDEDTTPDYAVDQAGGWYDYNIANHVLTPRQVVFVVHTVEGNYVKLEMLDYYDDAGTSGIPKYRAAAVSEPTAQAPTGLEVDASAAGEWVYIDAAAAALVEVTDPATSDAWDLALSRTKVMTNGGTSGPGLAAARETAAGTTWQALTATSPLGLSVDEMIPLPGPPGSGEFSGNAVLNTWYDYDTETHAVSPRDAIFILRTVDGAYVKLRFASWDDGAYVLDLAPVDLELEVVSTSVAPPEGDGWTYLDLRANAVVTVDAPETDLGWDLGVSGTMLKTNGGTSGAGEGAAVDAGETALADVMSAPTGRYEVDKELPRLDPPGSGTFSGNPVLNGWYDYDPTTHAVSPNGHTYVLKTADGGFVKLHVTGYADGTLDFDWAYAGAGRDDF